MLFSEVLENSEIFYVNCLVLSFSSLLEHGMRGGVSLTSSISVLSFLGFASLQLTLRESANNICLVPDWEDSSLRAWVGVVSPDYPRAPSALQEFREALNGPAKDV